MIYTRETQLVVMFKDNPRAVFDCKEDAWSYAASLNREYGVEDAPAWLRASVVEVDRNPKEVGNANPT